MSALYILESNEVGDTVSDGGIQVIQMIASMSVPLFLLASFSYILQNKEKCGQIILFYLAMSAIIPILFSIIFFHFGAGIVESFFMNANESVQETVNRFAADAFGEALNCNIFIDMLLFSSLTFFLTAKTFAFVGLVDFLFIIIWGIIRYVNTGNMNDFEIVSKVGLGKSADLMLIAPFTLLFSYNRKSKIANYNLILPIF